jgi:hypothetical protein
VCRSRHGNPMLVMRKEKNGLWRSWQLDIQGTNNLTLRYDTIPRLTKGPNQIFHSQKHTGVCFGCFISSWTPWPLGHAFPDSSGRSAVHQLCHTSPANISTETGYRPADTRYIQNFVTSVKEACPNCLCGRDARNSISACKTILAAHWRRNLESAG